MRRSTCGLGCAFLLGCGSRTGLEADRAVMMDATADAQIAPDVCTRLVLSESARATRFAIDEAFVYYVEHDGRLARVPKIGGAAQTIASDASGVFDLAVDDAFVYWTTSTGPLVRVAKTGGTPAPIECTGPKPPPKPNTDGGFPAPSCWRSTTEPIALRGADVVLPFFLLPKTGGTPKAFSGPNVLITESTVDGLLADIDGAYWFVANIVSASLFDGPPQWLVSGPKVGSMAVDAKYVYWTRYLGYAYDVARKAKDGSDEVEEILPRVRNDALAVDDEFLFVVSPGISKVSKKDLSQSTLLEPDVLPTIIVSESKCIYYLAPTNVKDAFRLARVPK